MREKAKVLKIDYLKICIHNFSFTVWCTPHFYHKIFIVIEFIQLKQMDFKGFSSYMLNNEFCLILLACHIWG